MADNLVLKGSTWHVRLELPADVRHAFGNRRKLTKSLKTGNKVEAHIRKLPVLSEWKARVRQARRGVEQDILDNELYSYHSAGLGLRRIYQDILMNHIYGKIDFNKKIVKNNNELNKKHLVYIFENDADGLKKWNDKLDDIENRFPENERASAELVLEYQQISQDIRNLINHWGFKDKGFSEKQADELISTINNPEDFKPKSPFTSQRLDAFAKHQVEIKGLAQKTVDTFRSKLKVLKNYLEKEGIELSFESYQQFLDSLNVSTSTKKNHIHAGSSFHKWASKYDKDYKSRYDTRDNPFLGHELPNDKKKGKKKEEKRLAFKTEEVKKLYEFAISKRKHQVAYAIKIAGLTGCRIEEICRLTKNHIVAENGVLSLYIEEGKTDASIRKIPIHPSLKSLIDQLVKNADDGGYLIHSSGGNQYGIRSDSISKAFGRIKRDLGYDTRYVFHSIRKTVITSLQHNDVKPLVIASIVGHETGTVTFDIYSEGASAKQKRDAIETLPNL
ncbi:tyrosine-type recombinase/integrase [Halomonas sp. BC2]|uniref:tyrosine-type recombinase/integrase n=1 Tax=Halomonas sp. BC2 TaxID=1670449 RepID=UPI0009C03445|nr:tyrosine-type recombinase/integrase [Halomonas sp. BC2]